MSKRNDVIPLRLFLYGREVTRANWHSFGPEVTEERLDAIAELVFEIVAPLNCATHGKKADVEARGESLASLRFAVTACCEPFRAEVSKALGRIGPTTAFSG